MTTLVMPELPVLDKHLDAVLRASGSALKHYVPYTQIDMRKAMRDALEDFYRLGVEAGTPKWLPIESAPKDGTAILVCLSDSDSGYVVFWVDPAKGIRDYVGSKIGWHIAYCGDFLGPCDAPTHWQPLPKGPKDV